MFYNYNPFMKLNNLDLNLLVVFNAIYTEGSLTKAGEIAYTLCPEREDTKARPQTAGDL